MGKCPDCKLKLIVVKFRYDKYTGQCIPDGVERFFCLECGYQRMKIEGYHKIKI